MLQALERHADDRSCNRSTHARTELDCRSWHCTGQDALAQPECRVEEDRVRQRTQERQWQARIVLQQIPLRLILVCTNLSPCCDGVEIISFTATVVPSSILLGIVP